VGLSVVTFVEVEGAGVSVGAVGDGDSLGGASRTWEGADVPLSLEGAVVGVPSGQRQTTPKSK